MLVVRFIRLFVGIFEHLDERCWRARLAACLRTGIALEQILRRGMAGMEDDGHACLAEHIGKRENFARARHHVQHGKIGHGLIKRDQGMVPIRIRPLDLIATIAQRLRQIERDQKFVLDNENARSGMVCFSGDFGFSRYPMTRKITGVGARGSRD